MNVDEFGVEAIGVGLEPTPLGFDKDKGEGVELLVRAEPGKPVGTHVDGGLEVIGVAAADRTVYAVGCHDQVGIGEFSDVVHLALEDQFHAQLRRAVLQDVEQAFALDAAEAMAAGTNDAALEMDVDIVPVDETVADAPLGPWIAALEVP